MKAMKPHMGAHPSSTNRSIDTAEGRPGVHDLCGEAWLDTLFDATHLGTTDRIVARRTMP
jgi:hypothetical protein